MLDNGESMDKHRFIDPVTLHKNWLCTPIKCVAVETQSVCNRRCSYCPNSIFDQGTREKNRVMELSTFYKIVDELAELDFAGRLNPHRYNEPLMDKRLPDLMAYARKKLPKVSIVIFTNGDYLNVDLYKRLTDSGVNKFEITQHSQGLSDGTREVMDYRRKYGDDSVTMLCHKFTENKALSNRGGLLSLPKEETRPWCYEPFSELVITPEGDVCLCCCDYFGTVTFGNVREERLIDIWWKPSFLEVKEKVMKGDFELEICQRCAHGDSVIYV